MTIVLLHQLLLGAPTVWKRSLTTSLTLGSLVYATKSIYIFNIQ